MKKFLTILIACTLIIGGLIPSKKQFFMPPKGIKDEIADLTIKVKIDQVAKHEVMIFSIEGGGYGVCTGTVLKNEENEAVILTAKHCIDVTTEMFVGSVPVTSIQTSVKDDLALLKTVSKLQDKTVAVIATEKAPVSSELFGFGYGRGRPFPLYGKVIINGLTDSYADMTVEHGCSGGGLFNSKGELVGVVWGGLDSMNIGIYDDVINVRRFLAEINYTI